MVFEETTGVSFQFQTNQIGRIICEFEMDFKKSFCWRSYLSDDEIISAYARSENGYRF